MTTKVLTIKHPGLKNRSVSVVFVNNILDMPSFRFLCNEAVSGGRQGSESGKTTHRGRAYKIAELYEHLGKMGLHWNTCEEYHIEQIRNAMLHWNEFNEYSPKDYMIKNEDGKMIIPYRCIKNNSMNEKLSVWFKFFKYQLQKKVDMNIRLSSKIITISTPDAKLQHLYGKRIGQNKVEVERWELMVRPSPEQLYFPAMVEAEYAAFKSQLMKIDPVYAAIAELGVSSGLRKDALLNVSPSFFKSTFIEMNIGGKTLKEGLRTLVYENKGGSTKTVSVPLQTIQEIKHIYMNGRPDRKLKHLVGNFHRYDENYMWFRADGKIVEMHDLDDAFRRASKEMGRIQGVDNIRVHHLRHTYATWTVLKGAEVLNIDLLQLDAKLIPGLMFWLQQQLAHVDERTTAKYIASAIIMITPKVTGPLASLEMMQSSVAIKELLENDAKFYFGTDYNHEKFNHLGWAKFRGYDMESANIISLKKDLRLM